MKFTRKISSLRIRNCFCKIQDKIHLLFHQAIFCRRFKTTAFIKVQKAVFSIFFGLFFIFYPRAECREKKDATIVSEKILKQGVQPRLRSDILITVL